MQQHVFTGVELWKFAKITMTVKFTKLAVKFSTFPGVMLQAFLPERRPHRCGRQSDSRKQKRLGFAFPLISYDVSKENDQIDKNSSLTSDGY
jgi:hypothetical protein